VNIERLVERLDRGEIVAMARSEWDELVSGVDVVEDHDTGISGHLLIVRVRDLVAAVEEPKPSERVVRPFAGLASARTFVQDRLDTYERMWDGCGCKVDYYR